jgi:hypothetical protein
MPKKGLELSTDYCHRKMYQKPGLPDPEPGFSYSVNSTGGPRYPRSF